MNQAKYTEEQMRDFLELEGYDVGDGLDLYAKARALNFEFDEKSDLWITAGVCIKNL